MSNVIEDITFNPDYDLDESLLPPFDDLASEVIVALLILCGRVVLIEKELEMRGEKENRMKVPMLFVNANDFFYYATADCEPLSYSESPGCKEYESLKQFYELVRLHGTSGVYVWLIERRQRQPHSTFINRLKSEGLWKTEYDSYPSSYT